MSNAKHTPGPWGYSQWPDRSIYNIHAGGYPTSFATVQNVSNARGCMGSVETQANARLIAAAPELLSELCNALAFIDEAASAGILDAVEVQQQFERARAAITKASESAA